MTSHHVIVIGAGPAGLTAGYLLSKANIPVIVLEADPAYVGGIARTMTYQGYCFDIGGHRFFSKSKAVEDLWTEILGSDMLTRPRSSRIYYNQHFYSYPLKTFEVLSKLGYIESIFCVLSYVKSCLFPIKHPKTFTDWVSNQFGRRLFNIFFKTYTEKVWGMPCAAISADWAAQRIKGLSLFTAIMNAIQFKPKKNKVIKTLINTFRYPRKGPGMLWEACAKKIEEQHGVVYKDSLVTRCQYDSHRNQWQIDYLNGAGETHSITGTHLISSAPLRELVLHYLSPHPEKNLLAAASQLKYRDFLIVALILKDKQALTDNWIYIHDPNVKVARVQNFKSWSPEMVPEDNMCCYGMEYFCFENDGLWRATDSDLIQQAKQELVSIGLAEYSDIVDGCVIRQPKAYPVYDSNYKKHVQFIRQQLDQQYPTLQVIGRNGMHKYNNQDHAMMTAMLAVKNILANKIQYDVWNVNEDAEYHEAGNVQTSSISGLRSVPEMNSQ